MHGEETRIHKRLAPLLVGLAFQEGTPSVGLATPAVLYGVCQPQEILSGNPTQGDILEHAKQFIRKRRNIVTMLKIIFQGTCPVLCQSNLPFLASGFVWQVQCGLLGRLRSGFGGCSSCFPLQFGAAAACVVRPIRLQSLRTGMKITGSCRFVMFCQSACMISRTCRKGKADLRPAGNLDVRSRT